MAEPWKEFGEAAEPAAGPWAEYKNPATTAPKLQPGTEEDSLGFLGAAARGFKRSVPETKSLLYGGAAALGGAVGADGVRDWGLENYERVQREEVEPLASKSGFQSSLKGDTSIGEWAGDTIGNFGGQALQSLAAAGAGAAVGSVVPGAGNVAGAVGGLVAKGAVKKGVELAVKKMVANQVEKGIARDVAESGARKAVLQQLGGAAVAGTGLNIAQETGIAYTGRATDAAAAGEDLNQGDALRAIGWGVPAGLVDTAAEAIAAGRLARGVSGSSSLLKRVVGGGALGAVTEGGTEAVQAAMERAGAGQEVTGEEAVSDYIENAAAGALGGSTIGGASGVKRRSSLQMPDEAQPVAPAPSQPFAPDTAAPVSVAAPRRDDAGFRAQLAEQSTLRYPTATPGSLSDAANVLEVNPAAGGLVDAANAQQQAELDAKAEKAKPAKQEKPEPTTPPANMDPETGEMLSIDATVWPGAAEHQQPARIVEALIAEAMKGGRPSGVTRISETYNIPMETARALRKRAVADLAKPISAAPASQDDGLSASAADVPLAAADAEQAVPAARGQEQAVRSESEVLGEAGASASAPIVERAQDTPLQAEDSVYDESDEEQPDDIGSPSGGPFTISDAAQRVAARTEGGKVYEVAGGFVVRTPRATVASGTDTATAQRESAPLPPEPQTASKAASADTTDPTQPDLHPTAPAPAAAQEPAAAAADLAKANLPIADQPREQPADAPAAVPARALPAALEAQSAPLVTSDRAAIAAATDQSESPGSGGRAPGNQVDADPASADPASAAEASEAAAASVSPSSETAQSLLPATANAAVSPQAQSPSRSAQELNADGSSGPAQSDAPASQQGSDQGLAIRPSAQATPAPRAEQAAPAAGVSAGPRVRVKQGKPVYDEQDPKTIAAYFKPGDIVESYGGGTDRVVSFNPGTGKGDWSVRVVRVNKDGSPVAGESERTHKTAPLLRELVTKFGKPQVPAKKQAKAKPGAAIAASAAEAATSPANDRPEPTEAQKEAGNYAKGHHRIGGLDISIENPAGTRRRPEWPPLKHHYGYFKGTIGFDKDHVDVFLTDHAEDQTLPVFVVDQVNKDGSFDEHKVILGAVDEAAARAAYLANYGKGWTGLGAITQMSHDEFKTWLGDSAKTKRPAGDISAITPSVKTDKKARRTPALDQVSPDDELVAYDNVQLFSKGGSSGLTFDRALQLKQKLTAKWGANAPNVILVENADGLPDSAKASPDFRRAEGFFSGRQTVWLNVGMIRDEKRFAEVLAHEALGHFGVEQVVGEKEWRAISDTIARHDRDGTGAESLRKVMADVHRKQPGLAPDVFAREVIAFMAEKGVRSGLLDRVVAAVRRYLRQIMPALEWTHRDLVDLLGQADSFLLRGTSRIERQAAVRAYAFSRALATPISDTFKALAKMDGAFRYSVSEKDTLGGVFADVDPSMTVTLKGTANTSFTRAEGGRDLADKYEIQTADGQPAYVYVEQGGDRMYLDASSLTPGASGGTALYMGLFNYARNAGKVFIGDPSGLSDAALIRRTELMAAAALKYGGTDFMRPHPRQLAPGFRWATPLQWGDDQAANLESLLGTAYNNVLNFARGDQSRGVLGIDDVRFDFGKNEFLGPGDKAVTRDQLEGIAARARKAFASRPGADDNGREASFGRASIARAVLAQSALRESQQGAQSDLVGSDLRVEDGGRQSAAPGPLSGILYSKADLQVDGRGRRTMTLAGETFVERGNRYYLVNGTGEPKDFRTLGAAKEAAVATGGEILQDEAIEGVLPTWSVVAPASMAREAEVSRGLFSKAVPADILEDVEAVMRGGDQVGLLARARAAIAEATPKKLKDQLRGTWLGALTTRHLTELGSDYFENIRHYSDFLAEMGADRNKLQAEGEDVAEGARKWAGKNRAQAKALFDLMHASTIDGVDPSKEFKPLQFRYSGQLHDATEKNVKDARKALQQQMRERAGDSKKDMMLESKLLKSLPGRDRARRTKYPSLVERWNALPAEAQQIYRDFRDLYEKRSDQVEQGLVDRINDTDAPDNQKRKIINVIRQQFETARLQGVYFPLQRFGRYFVAATKDDSQTFLMFERLSDLERAVKNLRGRGFTITAQGKKQDGTAKDAPSGTFVADVIQQMKKSGVSEATQDQIYQIYLQALPELSMRKHNIHRQAVPGFDTDAVRAFAFSMHHGAHQLARLRFAHKMQDTLDLLRKQQDAARKEEASDTRKIAAGDAVLEELGKRHEWIMNPQDSQLTNLVSSFGFVYYLGATPAAALVNLTQTAMVSYPFLASRFGGIKAMNHLLAGMRDSIRTAGHIQKTLTDPNEIRAHQVLQAMGALDKTQAHNLAGIAEGGLQGYNPAWSKAMEIIGWGFHKTEVVNREATGLAAYRLARADGQSFDEAVRFAAETINQTHFDYTNANRARFMQSGTAKTLLMFRQYSLNMTWHLARMVWKATKGESPEVKRIARRNLAGILGMSSLFSGLLGLPLMSVTMGVLNAIASSFGDDDEPWDAETEFRSFLVDMLGKDAAETLLGGVANKVTGADVASRVSLSQLWFRDADRELDGRGAYYNLLEQAAGPMGGVLKNALVGKHLMDEGHLMRGFETMLPKSLKDMVKASRYATEGVNNLRGDPLVADPGVYRTLLQLGGFTPAKVADQYDRNRALKNYEQHILDRRQHLMDGFAMAMRLGDTEGRSELLAKIRTFNQTNPEIAISSASIKRSLASRARYSKQAEAGIVLNPKLAAKVRAAVGE